MKLSSKFIIAFVAPVIAASSGVSAQVPDDLSCAHFSDDPNDRSGPPLHFQAEMWDGPQRAPTSSDATGMATFTLERDTLRLTWEVTFEGLTSTPSGLHVHGPTPAEGSAPAVFALAGENFTSPVTGERVISIGEVSLFVQNLAYVNLHTSRYPEGEIRGSIKKQRPQC